ncbi:ZIP zinc transporter-domain-containing protein [Chytridium lagenaria]|nr:ZIP zinc transporter-domain-containing protein [Chytridium lagenaria]
MQLLAMTTGSARTSSASSSSSTSSSSLGRIMAILAFTLALLTLHISPVHAAEGDSHEGHNHGESSPSGTIIVEHVLNPVALTFKPADFTADIFATYGSGAGSARVLVYQSMGIIPANTGEAADSHEGHDHGMAKFSKRHEELRIARRQTNSTAFDPCLLPFDLMTIYGFNTTRGLNRTQFERMSPGLVYASAAKLCKTKVFSFNATAEASRSSKPSVGFTWLYSIIAITIVTLICMIGIVFVPLLRSNPFTADLLLSFLIALGAGTLIADSLLHLIPEILKLHMHSGEHDHGGQAINYTEEYWYVFVMSKVYAFIYLFWSAEQFLRYIHSKRVHKNTSHQHGHSHSTMAHAHSENHDHHSHLDGDGDKKEIKKMTLWEEIQSVRPVAILILVGDTLHNFVDGLAIGASFCVSTKFGVTTSMAVLLHELPHELADYAILYSSGFTAVRAALLNAASNLSAFIGMAIGILVSSTPSLSTAQETILSIAAGVFLYIAMADLLPELTNVHSIVTCNEESKTGEDEKEVKVKSKFHPFSWTRVLAQHLGLWVGWLVMVLIALYGESIKL